MGTEITIIPTRRLFPKAGAEIPDDHTFFIYGCNVADEDKSRVTMNRWNNISIKGDTGELDIGSKYKVSVSEDRKSGYAGSYSLNNFIYDEVTTPEEQRAFLASILTEIQVNNIYEKYCNGENVISMIQESTFEYDDIKGIGEKTYESIRSKVDEHISSMGLLSLLSPHGLSLTMIKKIEKLFSNKSEALVEIRKNPYTLTNVTGIGFKKADEVALSMEFEKESEFRINSCIEYIVQESGSNGDSWIDKRSLVGEAVDLLNISRTIIEKVVDNKKSKEDKITRENVIEVDGRYTLTRTYLQETVISNFIKEKNIQENKLFTDDEITEYLEKYESDNDVKLGKGQREFFYNWNNSQLSFLIGFGGTGKTWVQNILLKMIEDKYKGVNSLSIGLYAPTGRASKKMSEYTGRNASTIHRRIVIRGNEPPEIHDDIIIIDESSMCDVEIISSYFMYIMNKNAKILFVGDDFQLPSVGVGNFLYDCINSGVVKVSVLDEVFRQEDDGITDVSTNVRHGNNFLNYNDSGMKKFGSDCLFHMVDSEYVIDGLIHYYKRLIDKYDKTDIMILSPTRKGDLGTGNLNRVLQEIANPKSPNKEERVYGKKNKVTYRIGDLVMNTVNNYTARTVDEREVSIFNGDTGVIIGIDKTDKGDVFIIDFEGEEVVMNLGDVFSSIEHAWAITAWKAQGSQNKIVINIVDSSATFQLNANLLYTMFSRAEEFMIVLGQSKAIVNGMRKQINMSRRSFLGELLVA